MSIGGSLSSNWRRWIVGSLVTLGFTCGVVLMLLWLAGRFSPKVGTDVKAGVGEASPGRHGRTVKAGVLKIPMSESAVGTIRAVHETTIASRILARVVEVNLKAGQAVQAGQVLVRLDDADLRARLQQAKAGVVSAEAAHAQAVIDEQRLRDVVKTGAASRVEYDRAALALKSTEAEVARFRATVEEVEAALAHATVRSPMDGIVIDKKVDVGDTVMPGQVLVSLFDPKRMQLIASVRESLAHRLAVGQRIGVKIDLLDKLCEGTISEIVPEAQSASRSFQVKVTGPCPAGIYTGMFGRILIPLDEEEVLVIPRQAVRQVGQLELVEVVGGGRGGSRAVRIGRSFGGDVEVLSGLRAGEEVVVREAAATQETSNG